MVAGVLALCVLAVIALAIWAKSGVMHAESEAWQSVLADPAITVEDHADAVVLHPAEKTTTSIGLVFYPGAKVDAEAYARRLSGIVAEGSATVVIVKPWLRLAIVDPRGLSTFTDYSPGTESWMVGGHSMGGVRACSAADNVDALVLFGSYCAADLSDDQLPVLSLAGSEDGLSTPKKVADAREKLPASATMVEISGASHSSFGDYGAQKGDGSLHIGDEQMNTTVTTELLDFAEEVRSG